MRASEQQALVARRMFLAGFLLLPWLWLLAAANFWSLRHDDRIRPCALGSARALSLTLEQTCAGRSPALPSPQ